MSSISGSDAVNSQFSVSQGASRVDFSDVCAAYKQATSRSEEHHAEVGLLSSDGTQTFARLGIDEEYGAHRVGSVTKMFTAFLTLKLLNDGVFSNGLETRCKDVIPYEVLSQVFEDTEAAGNMTLEQLLSHTSGLEFDDHCQQPGQRALAFAPPSTLEERFIQEGAGGRKYKHVSKPGEGIGFYSNAGLAVAGWMIEAAYKQRYGAAVPFSQIIQQELFERVFGLTDSYIKPGPTGDIIQSACGDMTSSIADLMKVAVRLQKGEADLEHLFGKEWQSTMLRPRDIFQHHGLGCSANATVIQHAGMNRELCGTEERDVTALVEFPLQSGEPGLVAMCDSSALGPAPQEQKFIKALETCAGITKEEVKGKSESVYELDFFCPQEVHLFQGNAYLATDVDPFAEIAHDKIVCSRNGMKHRLSRDRSIDGVNMRGYRDENSQPWLFISKENGRKIIYSSLCLLTKEMNVPNLATVQPDETAIQSLVGVYKDFKNPGEHPTYTFTEKEGRLYMRDGNDKDCFPCLYIPDDGGGVWVVSNPTGRTISIRFPENPDKGFLEITDILTGLQEPPHSSQRLHND